MKEIMNIMPGKYAVPAVVAGAAFLLLSGSFYTVNPTDLAGVRRLGTVVTAEPVGPGLHFKRRRRQSPR